MFSASISSAIFRDCTLPWGDGFHPDGRTATKSGTTALTHFHMHRRVVKSAELATRWASCLAVAATSPSCPTADEDTFPADEILKIQSGSNAWMCPERARETPNPNLGIYTISFPRRLQESRIFSGRGSASLRRLTNPLRGFIRRRLVRGACRPPSIPPVFAAFECVHACAWVGSAP